MKIKEHYYLTEYLDGWCIAVYQLMERKGIWPFRCWKNIQTDILYRGQDKKGCEWVIKSHAKENKGHEEINKTLYDSHGNRLIDCGW